MSARLTGSGIGRAMRCPAAYALPATYTESSMDAQRGRVVHAYLESVARGTPRAEALEAVPAELRMLCGQIDLSRIPLGRPEVSFVFDVQTGRAREIEVPLARAYPPGDTEIPGTCDLIVAPSADRPARVIDFKTVAYDQPDPDLYRPQLEFYALCLARAHSLRVVDCEVFVIADDASVTIAETWQLDAYALIETARGVRRAWDRVQTERTRVAHDVAEGAHCRWCPAFLSCPAKRASVEATLNTDLTTLDGPSIAAAYTRAKDAEKFIERLRDLTRAHVAEHGPISTPDGRTIGLTRGNKALRITRAA